MEAEKWKQIKELLDEVLQIETSERQGFLDKSGISEDVRAEVESLLAVEGESENLMNLSAVEYSKDFFDDEESKDLLIGQDIGVYRIVREIGQGGMGAVYLATRTDGKFDQKVALKLLKREMNTAAVRRRFQQEQQILASLEHPNIARLLDAGTTDDKIPYIAMEYVEGIPIDEYCSRHNLDLSQRLDLFREVCAAVNFAHRNLIVHRDLKPSNILVDEEGTLKLLDFGISKILSAEFPQVNSATVTRLGAMTPSYASPEQLQSKSVTTATDIYSLGVILYELLSGHRPFETKEHDLKEIYKAVLENEPLPPSSMIDTVSKDFKEKTEAETIIKSVTDTETEASAFMSNSETGQNKFRDTVRQTSNLNSQSLKGDLDNIVLKALRKEPERRYLSAENFSEDIKRYLRGLPVTARPNTFSYRAEKFIKRNRASVIAAIIVFLAIIGGIIATLWQAKVARAERAKAERRFGDVRKLANSYLFDIFPEIEDLEGSLKAREKILKTALEYLDSLSQEAEGDLELQRELATAYEKVGEVQGAVNIANQGDIQAGLASYKKAQKLREAVFAASPKTPEIKEELSKNYQVIAQTLMWNIDTASAAEYFEKAIKLRRELVAENPDSVVFKNRLAVLLSDSAAIPIFNVESEKSAKLLDESAEILKGILKTNPEHFNSQKAYPRVLRAYSQLKAAQGDFDGAIKDVDESVALTAELIKQKSDDYALKRTAWLNELIYCDVYMAKRDGKQIVESCLKTVDFNIKALEKEPDESYALYDLSVSYYDIAEGYLLSGEPSHSLEYARKALEPMVKLDKIAPGTNDYMQVLANIKTAIGDAYLMLGQTEEALKSLQEAQTNLEKVVETDKSVTPYQVALAKTYRSLAKAYNKKGDKDKSVELINKAITITGKLKAQNNLMFSDINLPEEFEKEKAEYTN